MKVVLFFDPVLREDLATLSDQELQEQALDYERKLAATDGETTIDGVAIAEQFVANTSTQRTGRNPGIIPVSRLVTFRRKSRGWA